MLLENVRLKGFIGIKKGMGLDEITLPLADLSGLVALAGPNGHGKTTVLDNLHPFRQLASRKKSLNHHVFRRDSEKELSFNYNGDHYRTLLKIDAESDLGEGYIWKNNHSEVNGKRSEYDRYITDLLGSPNLFFNSVFCAQNADKLSDMTTGDVKKLFSEFLRLDRLVNWEATCKQCISVISGNADRIGRELEAVRKEADAKAEAAAKIEPARERIAQLEADLKTYRDTLALLKTAAEELQKQQTANQLADQQIAALRSERNQLDREINEATVVNNRLTEERRQKISDIDRQIAELDDLIKQESAIIAAGGQVEQIGQQIEAVKATIEDLKGKASENKMTGQQITMLKTERARLEEEIDTETNAYKKAEGAYNLKINDLRCRLDAAQKLMMQKDEIMTAVDDAQQTEHEIGNREQAVKALEGVQKVINADLQGIREEYQALKSTLASLEKDIPTVRLEQELKTCRAKTEDLCKKDPDCTSTTCAFIVSALDAENRIPELECQLNERKIKIAEEIERVKSSMEKVERRGKSAREQCDKNIAQREELDDILHNLHASLKKEKALADKLPELKAAQATAKDLKRQIAETGEDAKVANGNHDALIHGKTDRIETINAEVDHFQRNLIPGIAERLQSEEATLTNLQGNMTAEKALADKLPELKAAQATIKNLKTQRNETEAQGETVQAQHNESIDGKLSRTKAIDTEIDELGQKITPEVDYNLRVTLQNVTDTETNIMTSTELLTAEKTQLAQLEADSKRCRELCEKIKAMDEKRKQLTTETSEWIFLRNACGKDGLRALEIDSVAPVISGYANDLLHGTFGPNYSVKFATQDPETGKEILDILAIREDGSEVLLDNLSGGEKVWSLKALRLAMTLITQERSGRHYETLLADEEDGPLSEENATNFIHLYSSLMKVAGMRSCFYISHKPECVAMADHILEFGKGGVRVN